MADGLGVQRKSRARAQARQWDATGAAVDAAGAAVRWQASSVPGQVVTAPRAKSYAVHAF